jgi:antitoxin (DNA-binding transcriptional repressor) of toxin-antitoxin stability system
MSEEPVSVTTDSLHAASEHARSWEQAVERAERGETVAVLAHTRHVADVVPSGEIARLRETIDVLSDNDLLRELRRAWTTFVSDVSYRPLTWPPT